MTSSSLAGMHIQFRTLTLHSRPEEQLQERLRLKKFMISLLAAIGALGSPLGLILESDLTTYLYSGSTLIAITNESDRQISFNLLTESAISLSSMIRALGSPLGPHPESDLPTDLYSGSTSIAIMDESDRRISFNLLTEFVISLSAVIRASDSPVGPRPERDLATYLYTGSTPIAIKDESNCRIRFRRLQKVYNITIRSDQGIGLSSRNPSKNRSRYIFILWLCTSNPL
jgi:hypothetical protein